MIEKGEIPMVDCAIFADTKGEPKAVYEWLAWLESKISYPVYKVSRGDLRQDCVDSAEGRGKYKFLTIPVFSIDKTTNKKGILQRQCTNDYKIQPVHKKIRELLGLKVGEKRQKGTCVELLMGISYDEMNRMRENRIKWVTNVFPLIEMKWRRGDCKKWFSKRYNKIPPRSACTFCPYKTSKEWKDLKEGNQDEWKAVVDFDKRIRLGTRNDSQVFLHHSCKSIDEVDFADKQLGLFRDTSIDDECEGMCGV
jgi:hypothetical protein